jgi:hypothetical protein
MQSHVRQIKTPHIANAGDFLPPNRLKILTRWEKWLPVLAKKIVA